MKFQSFILSGLIALLGSAGPALAQSPRWLSPSRLAAANDGTVPSNSIQFVLKAAQDPTLGAALEFHALSMTRGAVEIEVFSVERPDHRLFKAIGGIQGEPSAEAREGQQRIRFKNTFNDKFFNIVFRDMAAAKTARIRVSANQLDQPVAVFFK